ncbi:MAG TPA: mucoidy inhibitor MuiA family protein [Bacteroidota bacterium]|nr:mucoidy inhibitor MuiA family protein [Bacteroidota bacterium]
MIKPSLVALLFLPLSLFPQNQRVRSAIHAVTVYLDRAVVSRVASSQARPGIQTVVIPDLPVSLIDQSVRVSGEAEGGATILDVKVETVFLDTIPEQRIKQLQDRLKALRQEERAFQDRSQVLRSQREFVDSLRVSMARSGGAQRGSFEDFERMLSFIDRRLSGIFGEIRVTNQALEDVRSKIDAVQREINQSQAYSRKSQKQVVVNINAERSGMVTLRISYVLLGASWSPLYEARVSSELKSVQFTYAAQVRQSTTEDWNDVELTLSTARPAEGGTPPILMPWFVDVQQLRPFGAQRKAEIFEERDASRVQMEVAAAPVAPMAVEVAEVQSQATSVVFKIPSKVTIPSDNNPHKVTIIVETLPVELSYSALPKYSQFAYLKSKTKNSTEYPFLAGMMNVFFENTFVGTTSVRQILPGEEFETGLAVDEGVRLERKLINRFTEYTGTFTKKSKVIYDILLRIENAKRVPVELVLLDQIPISRNEQIVVEQMEPSPKSLTPDQQGILQWPLKLNPGEKREIKLKFSVEYPRDWNIIGLE